MFSTDTTMPYRTAAFYREMLPDNADLMDRVISLLDRLSAKVNEELSEKVKSIKNELKQQREKVETTLEPIREKKSKKIRSVKDGTGRFTGSNTGNDDSNNTYHIKMAVLEELRHALKVKQINDELLEHLASNSKKETIIAGWHYFGMRVRVTLNEDKNLRHKEGPLTSSSDNVTYSARISSFGVSRFVRNSNRLVVRT